MTLTLLERQRLLEAAAVLTKAGHLDNAEFLVTLACREPNEAMGRDMVSKLYGDGAAAHANKVIDRTLALFDLDLLGDASIAALAQLKGWEAEQTSLYDEEGVEGWRWTSPDGRHEYSVIGLWDSGPVELSDDLRQAIIATLR